MKRAAVPFLSLALAATTLSGCGLFGGSSRLDDALEVVPGSADRVIFVDRAAIAERFEVDDIETGASESELEEYLDAGREFPLTTELSKYLVMMQDQPFSDLDVEWEVTFHEGQDGSARVWKMQNDLDLDEVGDALVDDLGFEEQGAPGDARSLAIGAADIDSERAYLSSMTNLTIVPDAHLMITGGLADDVLDVVDDDTDSSVDSGHFEDLVDGTDDIEVATMGRGEAACALGSHPQEQLEESGIDALGHPEQTAFFVHGDEAETRSVLAFDDDESAEEDAGAREAFLDEGISPISGVPYSEFGEWEIETDGDQVRIDIEYDEPRTIPAVISRGDYLSVCQPG